MRYKILKDRVKLIDSYSVPKAKFTRELNMIRDLYPSCILWRNRDLTSLRREWAAHNLAYALGIRREKTADADLNFEQKWHVKLAYGVIGAIALLVIK